MSFSKSMRGFFCENIAYSFHCVETNSFKLFILNAFFILNPLQYIYPLYFNILYIDNFFILEFLTTM